MRPHLTDLMRAMDDLEEVKAAMMAQPAPEEWMMEAERQFVRALAILHAHVKGLLAEPA